MYYKIEKSGCCEDRGLLQIRYDLFLDEKDEHYSDYYIQQPIFPIGGYKGKLTERNEPTDIEDYKKLFEGLEKVWVNTEFCSHFCQFEPTVTDEEILYVGELVLEMAYKNLVNGNLLDKKNTPVIFNPSKKQATDVRLMEILNTNFATVKVVSEIPYRVK